MSEDRQQMFRNRLSKVYRHLGRQAKRLGVSCFRVYDHDLPEFPFCIEFYGDKVYMAEYRRSHGMSVEEHSAWIDQSKKSVSEILEIPEAGIFLKLRQRKADRLGQYRKMNDSLHEFVVEENGLKFIVNLSDYLDTGLFLDHRITRGMVRDEAQNKRILNLFAYTGSFSVYGAAGGAAEVISIDLSRTYLEWAERNLRLNQFDDGSRFRFIHADVKEWLDTVSENYFDIIVMDPPTFSNSKRANDFLDIQRDHAALINACLRGLKQGGVLYFSTNSRKFVFDKGKVNTAIVKDITKATTPFDFEGKLARYCYKIQK